MSELIKFRRECDLTDFTLIVPSVSVGNLPQLTVDALICTYDLERTAIIWHPAIVPSVGANPFNLDADDVTTACELYTSEKIKLAVMQMRSSIEQPFAEAYFEALLSNIISLKFKQVVFLTSTFAHEMHDVRSNPYRCVHNNVLSKETLINSNVLEGKLDELHHGAGYAQPLYKKAVEKKISSVLLSKYTSEGDNRPDAMQMLILLNLLFEFGGTAVDLSTLKSPVSWNFVFGNPPPITIY